MQCHAIPCNTMQYHAIPCNTMQYYAIQCNTMQWHAIPCIINNCWRSVPLPCGQYVAIFINQFTCGKMLHAFWQSPYFILESPLLCGVLCTAVVTEFNQGQQYHWNLIFKVILNTWNRLIPIGIVVFRYIMVRSRKMAFLHQRDFCLLFQAIDSWHEYLQ